MEDVGDLGLDEAGLQLLQKSGCYYFRFFILFFDSGTFVFLKFSRSIVESPSPFNRIAGG